MTIIRTLPLIAALALAACSQAPAPTATAPEVEAVAPAPAAALNAAQTAYAAVNERMHAGMATIPADADEAFVVGMIPHHQGAIDMAKVVLEHGTDPSNKALAETIIKAQEAEIAEMKAWLAARGTGPAAAAPMAGMEHAEMGH